MYLTHDYSLDYVNPMLNLYYFVDCPLVAPLTSKISFEASDRGLVDLSTADNALNVFHF